MEQGAGSGQERAGALIPAVHALRFALRPLALVIGSFFAATPSVNAGNEQPFYRPLLAGGAIPRNLPVRCFRCRFLLVN